MNFINWNCIECIIWYMSGWQCNVAIDFLAYMMFYHWCIHYFGYSQTHRCLVAVQLPRIVSHHLNDAVWAYWHYYVCNNIIMDTCIIETQMCCYTYVSRHVYVHHRSIIPPVVWCGWYIMPYTYWNRVWLWTTAIANFAWSWPIDVIRVHKRSLIHGNVSRNVVGCSRTS